jgi:integrase
MNMAILAECPICHKKQSVKNKLCSCGEDLVKAKRSKEKVRYWINYRMPGGKQKREAVGYSVEEAKDADGKRRAQKRENTIFDIKPDAKMSFCELSQWYLDLEKVKSVSLAYYRTLVTNFKSLNRRLGDKIVKDIMPIDIENYQAKRRGEGKSDSYIDHELTAARAMINKAFDNDLVSGDVVKRFRNVEKLMENKNANARDRILTLEEYHSLVKEAPGYTKPIIKTAFWTGMRSGEILKKLTWRKVDLKERMIKLEATDTKDKEPRKIPISKPLCEVLKDIPRAIHDDHVFLYKGKPMANIKRSLKNACRRAGITYGRFEKEGFIFHDLRRAFNTYMRKAGVAQSVIMNITGHSQNSMFDRYNTIDDGDLLQAIDQLERYFANVDQNVDQVEKRG